MNRLTLTLIFVFILLAILAATTYASLDGSILKVPAEVTGNAWFHATLVDAYLGFLTFYVWVFYKETSWWRRLLWFVLIMCLGNIAMSIYVLLQLRRWPAETGVAGLLLRAPAP